MLDFQKIDDVFDKVTMLQFFRAGRAHVQSLPEQVFFHHRVAAGHDVVQSRHAFKQGDVLEGPGDALTGGLVRLHLPTGLTFVGDGSLLRVIKPINHVQHRTFTGPVRTDNGENLMLKNFETDVGQRLNAAE